jgi:AraC-type DNA-binding domain-containing proteins
VNEIIYAGKHLITFSVSTHAHSSWEFIYCTSGEGQLIYKDGCLPYRTGDMLLIPPMVYHRNESSTGFTNIHLNMVEPSLTVQEPAVIHDDANHFLLDAVNAIFYHFSSEPGKQTVLLSAYAMLFLTLINTYLHAPARNPVVEEIVSYIILNYPDENLELDTYLRSRPFNYDYLRKLFKSEVGVTPHRFLSDTRLQAAAERLGRSDKDGANISEISHLCGFREPLYFSKTFRKKYGVSPSQYQERMQSSAAAPSGESIKISPDA